MALMGLAKAVGSSQDCIAPSLPCRYGEINQALRIPNEGGWAQLVKQSGSTSECRSNQHLTKCDHLGTPEMVGGALKNERAAFVLVGIVGAIAGVSSLDYAKRVRILPEQF